MDKFIDQILTTLFRVADYVVCKCSSSSDEPAENYLPTKTIRFSQEDFVPDC